MIQNISQFFLVEESQQRQLQRPIRFPVNEVSIERRSAHTKRFGDVSFVHIDFVQDSVNRSFVHAFGLRRVSQYGTASFFVNHVILNTRNR
jgi:hypothetical protein